MVISEVFETTKKPKNLLYLTLNYEEEKKERAIGTRLNELHFTTIASR